MLENMCFKFFIGNIYIICVRDSLIYNVSEIDFFGEKVCKAPKIEVRRN